ncbi:hypothetical protein CGGC5_v013062 [Colletotrichum fructicola Nara gc5]|uniref:Uncharacterized protein n=1 Tax=Colletotrichum fructicola (strain Nara gc5) TaxID=1213859 RepID=A0A7J6INM1_COLFN|nr:hypothetical protein CGGC5_v013062 [Colletotrichum fructicola Nara gc5]
MKLRLDPQLWNTLEGYRISWKVMRTLSAHTQWKLLEEDSHVFKDEKGTTLSQNGSSFLQLGMLVVADYYLNEIDRTSYVYWFEPLSRDNSERELRIY